MRPARPEQRLSAFASNSRTAVGATALLVGLLLACGGSTSRFEGAGYPAVITEDDIKEANQTPAGEVVIGEVVVRCDATSRSDLFGLFSNRRCGRDDLLRQLKEKAARAGGQTLVARRCDFDVDHGIGFDNEGYTEQSIECHADVSRSKDFVPTDAPEPLARTAQQQNSPPPSALPPPQSGNTDATVDRLPIACGVAAPGEPEVGCAKRLSARARPAATAPLAAVTASPPSPAAIAPRAQPTATQAPRRKPQKRMKGGG